MKLARALSALGRTFITAGVLILLFVAYQLWGTNIHTAREQNRLEGDLAALLEQAQEAARTTTTRSSTWSSTTSSTTPGAPTTTATLPPSTVAPLPPEVAPPEGEVVGRIEMPTVGADWVIVQGVSVGDLKKGPGHYPDTPFPGEKGNAAIAGHRTTYGAPFHRVDELAVGDEIIVTTVQGRFVYGVIDTEGDGDGHSLVHPRQVEVLDDVGDNRLTLTSCHPKYTARQRIIVVGELKGTPVPTPPRRPPPRRSLDVGISGEGVPIWPAILWGFICALIWLAAWLIGRKWRRWPAYLIGLPIFVVALFIFFENFSRLLPANY
ncbi:MAG: class E sortase [Acidimicrobiales bacterium]